jgi:hypothetical protein
MARCVLVDDMHVQAYVENYAVLVNLAYCRGNWKLWQTFLQLEGCTVIYMYITEANTFNSKFTLDKTCVSQPIIACLFVLLFTVYLLILGAQAFFFQLSSRILH